MSSPAVMSSLFVNARYGVSRGDDTTIVYSWKALADPNWKGSQEVELFEVTISILSSYGDGKVKQKKVCTLYPDSQVKVHIEGKKKPTKATILHLFNCPGSAPIAEVKWSNGNQQEISVEAIKID